MSKHFDCDRINGCKIITGFQKYKCKHCGSVLLRESSKKWIKSYCLEHDKVVHLQLVRDE